MFMPNRHGIINKTFNRTNQSDNDSVQFPPPSQNSSN